MQALPRTVSARLALTVSGVDQSGVAASTSTDSESTSWGACRALNPPPGGGVGISSERTVRCMSWIVEELDGYVVGIVLQAAAVAVIHLASR